jgi:hypothetical protein
MTVAAILLVVTSVGLVLAKQRNTHLRGTVRNFSAGVFITVFCLFTGDGVEVNTNMDISRRPNGNLYDFIQTLPPDVRFGGHPRDLDSIPFWSGRAVLANEETAVPLLIRSWEKKKRLIEAMIDALYARRQEEVLDFAQAFGVTHLLLKSERYVSRSRRSKPLSEPFESHFRKSIGDAEPADLALSHIPEGAVLYRDKGWAVVDTKKLRDIWSKGSE